MTFFDSFLQSLTEYKDLLSATEKGKTPVAVSGISHIHKAHLSAVLSRDLDRRCVIITPDEGEATRFVEDLTAMGCTPLLFPARDLSLRTTDTLSLQYEQKRLEVLCHLLEGEYTHLVCSVDALLPFTLPPEVLYRRSFTIKEQEDYDPNALCEQLVACGYTRCSQVEGPGQFAKRGGILDIFPANRTTPVRLEFWGDTIDTINAFDVMTQRREDPIEELQIPPAREVLFVSPEAPANKLKALAEKEKNPEPKYEIRRDKDKRIHACLIPWEKLEAYAKKENEVTEGNRNFMDSDRNNIKAIQRVLLEMEKE